MGKRILYILASLVLLSIPWVAGGFSVTLLAAFVPLLVLQRERPKRFWIYVAATFALWWGATTWWVGLAAPIGAIAAVVIGTALNTAAFMLYDWILRKGTKALAYTNFVAGWISYELLYMVGELSFPWLTLGNGFAGDIKLVQWYEYTGVLGGSAWVLVVNLLVFNAWQERKNLRKWIAPAIAVFVPAAVSLIMYYSYEEPQEKVIVTIVQPNIEPYFEKFTTRQYQQDRIMMKLMLEAPDDVDFIVMPETAIDEVTEGTFYNRDSSVVGYREIIRRVFPQASLITGATTVKYYDSPEEASVTARTTEHGLMYDVYNSALHIDTTGFVDVHHKSILVAGAEKMPFYDITKNLDFLIVDLGGITGQLGVDTVRTVFTSGSGVNSGTAICYESIYGEYFGEFIKGGAQMMFIITNDGWWGDTPGYRNHFSFARLRAVETRRGIARSANTGKSGFIDQRGNVVKVLPWDVRGTITDEVALNDKVTVYARYGDITGRVSWLVLGLSVLYFISYRFRKLHHLEK